MVLNAGSIHKSPFAQPEFMHQAADVILIVPDCEFALDGFREPAGGPAIPGKTVGGCTFEIHLAYRVDLIGGQPAGTASGAPFAQTIHAFLHDGSLPARRGCAAHAIAACNL